MSLLTPVWNYVDALVHPSAKQDAWMAARHRAFIAPRLLGSCAALAGFPLYIAVGGLPSLLELGVFGWLLAPILITYFLSRTGRYEAAYMLSSLSLAGMAGLVAWCTGGIGSFAAVWLVVVPLEAGLSGSRRVVALASGFVLVVAGMLWNLSALGLQLPASATVGKHGAAAVVVIISAALYATGLAFVTEQLLRTSAGLLDAEEGRYRLLARSMTDVITRHGRNGVVLFVSPAGEQLFGVPQSELIGHGSIVFTCSTGRLISPRSPMRPCLAKTVRWNSASVATATPRRTAISPGLRCAAGRSNRLLMSARSLPCCAR